MSNTTSSAAPNGTSFTQIRFFLEMDVSNGEASQEILALVSSKTHGMEHQLLLLALTEQYLKELPKLVYNLIGYRRLV